MAKSISQTLVDLSIYCNDDYDKILQFIQQKAKAPEEFVKKMNINYSNITTLLDETYPYVFKKTYKPPLVLYSNYNDLNILNEKLLNKRRNKIAILGSNFDFGSGKTEPCLSDYEQAVIEGMLNDLSKTENKENITIIGFLENEASRWSLYFAHALGLDIVAYSLKDRSTVLSDHCIFDSVDNSKESNNKATDDKNKNTRVFLTEHSQPNQNKEVSLKDAVFTAFRICGMSDTLVLTGASNKQKDLYEPFIKYISESKELLVVPQPITNKVDTLCNDLIYEGATIYNGVNSISKIENIIKSKDRDIEL